MKETTRKQIEAMKAKETTRKQIEAMKAQTIGVEIEMYNITRQNAAKAAADFFGSSRVEYTASRNGYKTWSAYDTQGREWKFQRDASIKARTDEEKCEMVTPILTYDDIDHMCGVHIHIGAAGHDARSLRNLANLMASHEGLLTSAIRIDQSRIWRYCRTVNRDFLTELNRKKPQTMQDLADIWYTENNATYGRDQHYNDSRYHMLNLHATFTKGTIEFRLFQFANPEGNKKNGLHAGELKSYIQLCLGLSAQAKAAKSASPKEPQVDNPKFAMRTWLIRLGFVGEEFETTREILTRNLDGDAAFRHGRAA